MSVKLEDRWYSTEWHRLLGRYELSVAIETYTDDYGWEVWLGRKCVAKAELLALHLEVVVLRQLGGGAVCRDADRILAEGTQQPRHATIDTRGGSGHG